MTVGETKRLVASRCLLAARWSCSGDENQWCGRSACSSSVQGGAMLFVRCFNKMLFLVLIWYFLVQMSEPPFVPRERLLKKQQYFQNIHKHTYLKGPYDKITSIAIPLALAATAGYMIVRGIYNMSHGIGKKE
ncbi:hypothetical protein CKAN_02119700 [Cinnamomum micranthum f. kanehirae]|uniref:Uncharacterized protein n=1 Tax=Cinnamomum micranthum f. kanehirae TaxID=337451 RepID=A0A443PMK8_9MAGN|nr:hypothetical protein CKAN_02119700 [Cinnamomum micranthum f. kanehirae]